VSCGRSGCFALRCHPALSLSSPHPLAVSFPFSLSFPFFTVIPPFFTVIPAKAGIHNPWPLQNDGHDMGLWIPRLRGKGR